MSEEFEKTADPLLSDAIHQYCLHLEKDGQVYDEKKIISEISSHQDSNAQKFCDAMMEIHSDESFYRAYTPNGYDIIISR